MADEDGGDEDVVDSRTGCDQIRVEFFYLFIDTLVAILTKRAISAQKLNTMIVAEKGFLELYSNVNIALTIFLCLMMSNCSDERSFSVLRKIKNYLRSSQWQDRLNALAILCIEKDLTMTLDCKDLINKFAEKKFRKKMFYKKSVLRCLI